MEFSSHHHFLPIILVFVLFFLFSPVFPASNFTYFRQDNQNFRPDNELKMKLIKDRLTKINKPFVKSINSPDGDIIDCVLIHLQPAFDHPKLKGTMPLDPPETPNGKKADIGAEMYQLWSSKGDSCPNGTIPIRRTSEHDIFRSISISKFGKKYNTGSIFDGHEHAIGYVRGEEYYGAKATLNIWGPKVTNQKEFSLSQIWVMTLTSTHGFNTVEAGWQVNPSLYNDNSPRFFTYWTNDGYHTGCYNLLCPGFVQTNKNIALGAAFSPISTYNGNQFDVTFLIRKDPNSGNWWLNVGNNLIGYWPATLFPDLRDHATLIEFGGEVFSQASGPHTSTQMGSGHFPNEGFGKASYIKNMEVVDGHRRLIPVPNLNLFTEKPNCYDVRKGFDDVWGNYVFFGGPGNNPNCP